MESIRSLNQYRSSIWHPFSSPGREDFPLIIRGEGVYLHLEDGRKLIDGISSWWVNLHGHCHPEICKAISDQSRVLEHALFAGFLHMPALKLAKSLLEILRSPDRVLFFSDNGSTAVEVGLKLAIQHWSNLGKPRKKIIAFQSSYHGDTFGAMSVGARDSFFVPFEPFLFDVVRIPFPAGDGEDALREMVVHADERTAAFVFEPLVLGAGGMKMYSPSVLDSLMEVARSFGIICVGDEVMTGFGRTGTDFASHQLRVAPDIVCLSKGITGGFLPLGVTCVAPFIVKTFGKGDSAIPFYHGHSYTANPLSLAAAVKSIEILRRKDTQDRIQVICDSHMEFVETHRGNPALERIESTGTILAMEVKSGDGGGYGSGIRDGMYHYFLERGILLRPLGNVLYLMPPYTISPADLSYIYECIESFLESHLKAGEPSLPG